LTRAHKLRLVIWEKLGSDDFNATGAGFWTLKKQA
jgi:hypothetical protein